jgi:hypothetical protein
MHRIRNSRHWSAVAILFALAIGAMSCSKDSSKLSPSPDTYFVYVGNGFITSGVRDAFMYWSEQPFFAGGDTATASFDIGLARRTEADGTESAADTIQWIVISMNRLSERYERSEDEWRTMPGEVWIDAIENLQTGEFVGALADGSPAGWTVSSHEVYDVIDTTTGALSPYESIQNIIGPPDGTYSVLRVYDTAYLAIGSFTGGASEEHLIADSSGLDFRIHARRVPQELRQAHARPASNRVIRWDSSR